MKLWEEETKDDVILCLTIALILLSYLGTNILAACFNRIGFRGSDIPGILVNISYYLLLLRCVPIFIKRLTLDMLNIVIFMVGFSILSCLLFPENKPYIEGSAVIVFINSMPAFLIVRCIREPKIFIKYLYKTAYALLFFGMLYFFFYAMKESNRGSGYDMVFGYQICIAIIILSDNWIKQRNKLDLICIIFGMVMIIIRGSRGPILSITVFVFLAVLLNQNSKKKKLVYLFSFVIAGVLFVNYQQSILMYLVEALGKVHVYSRTLNEMLNNNMGDADGRGIITAIVVENIKLHPVIGYGIFGDRVFLDGTYPHNILLEIITQYGIIIGSVIVMGILGLLIFGMKNKPWRNLTLIFTTYVILSALFSGSYITTPSFWMMIGVLFNAASNAASKTIGDLPR
jgi:hypothetical protein